MFLFTGYYFKEMIANPGGLANYLGEFLVQFFSLPYVGSLVTALLLAAASLLTALLCKRIAPDKPLYVLYILPAIALLCIHFSLNYFFQGTIAYLMMLSAIYLYISLRKFSVRLICGSVSVFFLFWWAGPVALLYAVCAFLWELLNRTPKGYFALLMGLEAFVLAYGSVYFHIIGAYRFAFLPDLYHHSKLFPGKEIYFAWISILLVITIAWLFRNPRRISLKKEIMNTVIQLVLIVAVVWLGISGYIDLKSLRQKRFDYFVRTGQWDAIIERSKGPITNYLYLNYLNLALAEKGLLADELFKYDQRGVDGLFIPWNKTFQSSILLSDIYFAIGNSAISQEMAFEGNVSTPGYGNPRLFKRLIQTNLIIGAYPIAEKYIDVLECTLLYKEWAKEHRKFLYNDKMVENDPLLGEKRRCLVSENFLSTPATVGSDLKAVALQNPKHKTAIEYIGSAILLTKDVLVFKEFLKTFYGTEALPVLPRSFQEATITIYEAQPEMWEHYKIPQEMIQRFNTYKEQVLANKNNSGIADLMRHSFGDTYWFYYMFK